MGFTTTKKCIHEKRFSGYKRTGRITILNLKDNILQFLWPMRPCIISECYKVNNLMAMVCLSITIYLLKI